MFLLPFSRPAQLPAVNDVAVKDKLVAAVLSQKMYCLANMRVVDPEVYVREHNGSVMRFQIVQGFTKLSTLP